MNNLKCYRCDKELNIPQGSEIAIAFCRECYQKEPHWWDYGYFCPICKRRVDDPPNNGCHWCGYGEFVEQSSKISDAVVEIGPEIAPPGVE